MDWRTIMFITFTLVQVVCCELISFIFDIPKLSGFGPDTEPPIAQPEGEIPIEDTSETSKDETKKPVTYYGAIIYSVSIMVLIIYVIIKTQP